MAGFVDHGGAWYAGSPTRMGWDAGMGLRFGASRSSDTDALRFDLAHRFANDVEPAGWVLIVGKGFAFELGQPAHELNRPPNRGSDESACDPDGGSIPGSSCCSRFWTRRSIGRVGTERRSEARCGG